MQLQRHLLPVLALALQVSAQNPLSAIVSEAYSVYTEVTSIWNSDASAASAAAQSSSASSTTSSSSSSLTTSSSSSSTTTGSSLQQQAPKTGTGAASSSTAAPSSGGSHHSILPIVLGCVLGAVVLGLLLLLLLLCCRRRRRRDSRERSRDDVMSPEVESWRNNGNYKTNPEMEESRNNLLGHGHNHNNVLAAGAVSEPNMAEHPIHRNQNHENPFTPVPPAPRRTAPNSRAGLTDGVVPGEEPFLTDPKTGGPLSSKPNSMDKSSLFADHDHHKGEALAAGLGGAALSGAALHHHHKKEDEKRERDLNRDNYQGVHNRPTGQAPFLADPTTGGPLSAKSNNMHDNSLPVGHDHHEGEAIAGGLGGAALGGAALHQHHKKEEEKREGDLDRGPQQNLHGDQDYHRGEGPAAGLGGAALGSAALHHHYNRDQEKREHDLGRNRDFQSDLSHGNHDHHRGEALGAGFGGAALGGAALHHHHKKEEERRKHDFDRDHQADLLRGDSLSRGPGRGGSISRKPVASPHNPISPISPTEEHHAHQHQPLMPSTTSNDDAFALNKVPSRRSGEHSRSRHNSVSRDLAIGGTGAALGAAALHHHDKNNATDRDERSTSRGPHKHYIGDKVYSIPYNTAEHGAPPTMGGRAEQPNSMRQDIQPNTSAPLRPSLTPTNPNPEHSSHDPLLAAGAAGAAGVGAGALAAHHHNDKKARRRSRSRSFHSQVVNHRPESEYSTSTSSSGNNVPTLPFIGTEARRPALEAVSSDDLPPTPQTRSRRNSALGTGAPPAAVGSHQNQNSSSLAPVPIIPQEHRRNSGNGSGYYPPLAQNPNFNRRRDQTPPAVPSRSPKRTRFSDIPFDGPGRSSTDLTMHHRDGEKGIVGDNGYPHMGRRRTNDFEDLVPVRDQEQGVSSGSGKGESGSSASTSDDSTWRLSSGMPGGWSKSRSRERGSGSMDSTTQRPRTSGFFNRDSGLGSSGVGSGSRTGSMTSTSGGNGGRRLRLADLRREEEERELRDRGRRSVEGEWAGNGGYDGYEHYHPQGVGQAL